LFNSDDLHFLRADELEVLLRYLPPHSRVLELGAGTGYQALQLKQRGFEVEAIDLPGSSLSQARVHPVIDYDGRRIPFPDASFDVVFSSNVLEHIADLPGMLAETKRVLRPGGRAVHAMPSATWRFWTSVAGPIDALPFLLSAASGHWEPPKRAVAQPPFVEFAKGCVARFAPIPHGEGGNAFSELVRFRKQSWLRVFEENGFEVLVAEPMTLFYTGWCVLGHRWSIASRRTVAKALGSACLAYVVRPKAPVNV
jgi:SAM-dependent methyltransferase